MNAPSVRRRFETAMRSLETNYYYLCGQAADPTTFQKTKRDDAGPFKSALTDGINYVSQKIHTRIIDNAIDKALTGDHAPKPGGTDIAKAIAPTLARYASQIFRTPLGIGSAAALFGAVVLMNPQVQEDIGSAIDKSTIVAENVTNKIGKTIVDTVAPKSTIQLATMPVFRPTKINI